jgi:hypothetical protein
MVIFNQKPPPTPSKGGKLYSNIVHCKLGKTSDNHLIQIMIRMCIVVW